jgi:hypothetical protein
VTFAFASAQKIAQIVVRFASTTQNRGRRPPSR